MTGRPVVRVLHDKGRRAAARREPLEQGEESLEELGAGLARGCGCSRGGRRPAGSVPSCGWPSAVPLAARWRNSGSSLASSRAARPLPDSRRPISPASVSLTKSRSIAVNGLNGSPSAPSSRHAPVSTRAPASRATAVNSPISLVLPIPASPPMSMATGSPWRTVSIAACRAAISAARPTRTGLAPRLLISTFSVARGADIPARAKWSGLECGPNSLLSDMADTCPAQRGF